MDDTFAPAINKLLEEVKRLEEEAAEAKRTINKLCGFANRTPMFPDVENSAVSLQIMRRDQFFGVPLATAVKQYLEMRGDPKTGGQGAATVNEVFAALKQGGFAFETKNDENAKRALRVSLSKNTAAFVRVAGAGEAAYGLKEWYPAAKEVKTQSADKNTPTDDESAGDHSNDVPDDNHDDGTSVS